MTQELIRCFIFAFIAGYGERVELKEGYHFK
jgi:hypothetical protein